jgi:hypothetical protein
MASPRRCNFDKVRRRPMRREEKERGLQAETGRWECTGRVPFKHLGRSEEAYG